jgi:hypothetical protein
MQCPPRLVVANDVLVVHAAQRVHLAQQLRDVVAGQDLDCLDRVLDAVQTVARPPHATEAARAELLHDGEVVVEARVPALARLG